jgi:hypothetical protein
MRDVCILADESSRTYYAVSSCGRSVRAFTSKDLLTWTGPQTIFQTPAGFWGSISIRSIWAPELHAYKGRHYLFLTFDTDALFSEQWRKWRPRVTRGSQVLVGMIFTRFDGQLMLVLHQPNDAGRERARLFELEDTGDTLRIVSPFPRRNA